MSEDSSSLASSLDSVDSDDSNVRILTPKGLEFSLDLYRQSVAGNVENLFFSPLSISVALAMTLAGAKENTAKQIKDVLKLESFTTDSAIHEAFHEIIDSLLGSQDSAIKVHIANRMYVHNDANILADFRGVLEEHYNTSSTVVDFDSDVEKIRLEINKWVEEQTQTKIKDLVSPGILDDLTRLVLVNAIYFKGNWHQPFEPDSTNAHNFYLDVNKAVMTDFMHITAYFKYWEVDTLHCRIIELPYVGETFSMFVILPYAINGLKALEEMITVKDLKNLKSYMDYTKVILTLPKFKIESSLSLNDILSSMGISDLFNENKANLSGITGKKNLSVSAVLHKAFLEVNEEGSEAAATTAVRYGCQCGYDEDSEFRADHPFLLCIKDNQSGAIIFWGRLINPNPGAAVQEVQEVEEVHAYSLNMAEDSDDFEDYRYNYSEDSEDFEDYRYNYSEDSNVRILTQRGLEFTWDLYRQSVAGNVDNLFISPLSISVALAMTLAGAKENTAKQMKDVLKLGSFTTDSAIHEAFHEIIDCLKGSQDSAIKLHIANRMYVHNNANILAGFRGVLEENYDTSSTVVDFGSYAEEIRLEINEWVEEQTQTKIKDLISPGILDGLTRLVLVNAIYFKGNWHQQFERDRTEADNFYVDVNTAVMTDFMHITSYFRYNKDDNLNCRMIELPYVGETFSMFVILPYDINGLKAMEETLTVSDLESLMNYMDRTKVILTLPKFKIESSFYLNDILSSMGMSDLFNKNKANLSGITGKKDLFVSAVLHKAFLEVNEKGMKRESEPAASTAGMFTLDCGCDEEPEFRADHPFLLFLKDTRSGAIVCWGRLINPNPGAAVQDVNYFI